MLEKYSGIRKLLNEFHEYPDGTCFAKMNKKIHDLVLYLFKYEA